MQAKFVYLTLVFQNNFETCCAGVSSYASTWSSCYTDTVFIHINAPGAMHFSKGGGGGGAIIIYKKKNQLSSPVAMGDNGHLQP